MDIEAKEVLGRLIKEISETGEWTLEPGCLKSIKSLCKQSNANVEVAFELIFAQLKKEHAQIRYSCLQLCEELFKRSHCFRELLADEYPTFMQLTIGIHQKKLPPPAAVAIKLKQYAIALVKSWYQKFGDKLRPLGVGYDYLDHHGVLTQEVTLQSIHSHDNTASNKAARIKTIQERRYEQIKLEIEEHFDLIQENLKSMNGCFEILVPRNVETDSGINFDAIMKGNIENIANQGDAYKENILSHGLGSNRYTITIDMSDNPVSEEVKESEENDIIYEQLREAYKLLERKHLQQVTAWIKSLSKIEYADRTEKQELIKKLINCKSEISEASRKAELLGIEIIDRRPSQDNEEVDEEFLDELFEEVPIPEFDSENVAESSRTQVTVSSQNLPPSQRIFPLSYEPSMADDVTYSGAKVVTPTESTPEKDASQGKDKEKVDPTREALLKVAPVVEWGDDLYYWDKKNVQFNTSGIERSHRFLGVGEGTNEMPPELLSELRKRPIYYKNKIPIQLKACRHPLNKGGLCPRRDLVTCPFHGPIIPRDEFGIPAETEAGTTEKDGPEEGGIELWQKIESEVMVQAGQKKIDANAKRRKKKEPSALIDVRKQPESSITRIRKKLNGPKARR